MGRRPWWMDDPKHSKKKIEAALELYSPTVSKKEARFDAWEFMNRRERPERRNRKRFFSVDKTNDRRHTTPDKESPANEKTQT